MKVINRLINIPTDKTIPRPTSKAKKGIKAAKTTTGKIIFQFKANVANNINKKPDKEIKADKLISLIKLSKDKEKMKSYDLRMRGSWYIKRDKDIKNKGAKINFLSMSMVYSS